MNKPFYKINKIILKGLFSIAGIISVIFILITLMESCGKTGTNAYENCFEADIVEILDSGKIGTNEFVLVNITRGFQDKLVFLELYKNSVKFSTCGYPDQEAIDSVLYDGSERFELIDDTYKWPHSIVVSGSKIMINYANERKPIKDVPVYFKK